jgi:hypothetical protein
VLTISLGITTHRTNIMEKLNLHTRSGYPLRHSQGRHHDRRLI